MGARVFGGIIMMVFGLLFVLYGGSTTELDETFRYTLVILGDLLWIFGGVPLFFGAGSKSAKYWTGILMVIVALLAFLFFTGDISELLRYGILAISVASLVGALALIVGSQMMPAPGETFPMGSPQNIPPKMPVPEKKEEGK